MGECSRFVFEIVEKGRSVDVMEQVRHVMLHYRSIEFMSNI